MSKNTIDFENKKNVIINDKKLKSQQDGKLCYIWGKRFIKNPAKDKIYCNIREHCYCNG